MSRSFVGSSRSRTFGSSMSSRVSWSRRRSPPERSPTRVCWRGPVNPSRWASWDAESSLRPSRTVERTSSTASMTRRSAHASSSRTSWVRNPSRTVTPTLRRARRERHLAGEGTQQGRLAGPVDADQPDPVARCRAARCTGSRSTRSPTVSVASSRSTTSLPRRVAANRMSSTSSRGGGSSAMSAFAASMRNFGLLVRAGRAAAQPGQLLAQQVVAALGEHPGHPLALGLGEDVGRVAAVVLVRPRRRRPPRSGWPRRRGTSGRG